MPADLKRLRRICAIPAEPDLELAALGGTLPPSWGAEHLRFEAERLLEIATRLEALADAIAADFQTGEPKR